VHSKSRAGGDACWGPGTGERHGMAWRGRQDLRGRMPAWNRGGRPGAGCGNGLVGWFNGSGPLGRI
jgi:hypothetical protein